MPLRVRVGGVGVHAVFAMRILEATSLVSMHINGRPIRHLQVETYSPPSSLLPSPAVLVRWIPHQTTSLPPESGGISIDDWLAFEQFSV